MSIARMLTIDPVQGHAELRRWAHGLLGLEAAVELLLRACGGRLADPSWPWIRRDCNCLWLDADRITPDVVSLSCVEQGLLVIVEALASGHPVRQLADLLAEFDRSTLTLVLAAFAHAGGSHIHAWIDTTADGAMRLTRLGPVVDWPAP